MYCKWNSRITKMNNLICLFIGMRLLLLIGKIPSLTVWCLQTFLPFFTQVYKILFNIILTFYIHVHVCVCSLKLAYVYLFIFLLLKQLLVFFQVSKDLPEKQKEIEILLKDFIELDQQLNQLTLWVTPVKNQLELYNQVGQPGAFDIKVNFLLF